MAEIMIPSRGCVYIAGASSGGQGFYALNPSLSRASTSPILIEGVDTTLKDIVFPVATLDHKKYLYTMGDDFGDVAVNGVVLLGKSDDKGLAFAFVKKYFEAHRSAAYKKPITISCPGNVNIKFYLTSLMITRADPEFHLQFFAFRGLVAEPKQL
jgi:hypothetical protein